VIVEIKQAIVIDDCFFGQNLRHELKDDNFEQNFQKRNENKWHGPRWLVKKLKYKRVTLKFPDLI
jgi:hypothetical protein